MSKKYLSPQEVLQALAEGKTVSFGDYRLTVAHGNIFIYDINKPNKFVPHSDLNFWESIVPCEIVK